MHGREGPAAGSVMVPMAAPHPLGLGKILDKEGENSSPYSLQNGWFPGGASHQGCRATVRGDNLNVYWSAIFSGSKLIAVVEIMEQRIW